MNRIQQVKQLGQSFWLDSLRRAMLISREMQGWVEKGIGGVAWNPSTFANVIAGSVDYEPALMSLISNGKNAGKIIDILTTEDIQAAADLLRGVYDASGGKDGYAGAGIDPFLAHDARVTINEARRVFSAVGRPNLMIEIPATPEGIRAVRLLTVEGINVNATLVFSLETYRQVREAYIEGLETRAAAGGNPGGVASTVTFLLNRFDALVDNLVEHLAGLDHPELRNLLGKAAICQAKLAYQDFKETFASDRFRALQAKGAQVQRLAWAGTTTMNPAFSDMHYVEALIGPDTITVASPATIYAFLDRGRVSLTLEQDVMENHGVLGTLAAAGIDMEEVAAKLLDDGLRLLAGTFEKTVLAIDSKKADYEAGEHVAPDRLPGETPAGIHIEIPADIKEENWLSRIWRRDHTVWKEEPGEISNRLGWLNVTDAMTGQAPYLVNFANSIRDAGYRSVVLLGMGGSSLGAETLRKSFGKLADYPQLIVLDSTVPAAIRQVEQSIDLKRSLFLVSSKSGTTVETLSLYKYFRERVDKVVGQRWGGQSFVAITDPGTPLAELAEARSFLRSFLAPPDIGGRYSVLSPFGLLPAALAGIDIALLLKSAERMKESCAGYLETPDNPGAWLGGMISGMALRGRDKLTFICSPQIEDFGLWAEQLLAESTGKEGRGIIPVVGEPVLDEGSYSDDRLFVYLRLKDDENTSLDKACARLEGAGHPVVRLQLNDKYDLGAEFFRWEFATAVAGAVLNVNPFDQPDVQASKENTGRILRHYAVTGRLGQTEEASSIDSLLSWTRPGSYLALQAYLDPTPEMDRALAELRKSIMQRYQMATTMGYGPRYLHSTGQLHKGGPKKGLFLQLTEDHGADIGIPGEPYSFRALTEAEAAGDFQALQSKGRQVIRINLGEAGPEGIRRLLKQRSEIGTRK